MTRENVRRLSLKAHQTLSDRKMRPDGCLGWTDLTEAPL
jgi:hypothetical protein